MSATYHVGDTREVVASLPDGSVDLILTSPPFLALRSYLPADHPDKAKEIGSEPTPAAFVDTLLDLTAEWRRVLAPHGSLAVELGDTYAGSGGAGGDYADGGLRDGQATWSGSAAKRAANGMGDDYRPARAGRDKDAWPLPKSLSLIPEAYRLALAYGLNPLTGDQSPAGRWRVRNVVDWCRPNPPVGALGDKYRPSTSDLVVACVSDRRWFDLDAVRTEHQPRGGEDKAARIHTPGDDRDGKEWSNPEPNPAGAPPLDHWIIPPGGYRGSHYATFPAELCRIPVESMCPRRVCRTCGTPSRREVETEGVGESRRGLATSQILGGGRADGSAGWESTTTTTTGWSTCGCPDTDGIRLDGYHTGTGWRPGIVLDPFGGSGTVGLVATGRGRDAILIDLDARNLDLARERIGLWLEEAS